mmetsp:Transcript_36565/g.117265  ORF Transcript_36565/g.117265 Transcript_36565/m.117265 type:complete len:263 (-) Transcript_36565:292-1080(-)
MSSSSSAAAWSSSRSSSLATPRRQRTEEGVRGSTEGTGASSRFAGARRRSTAAAGTMRAERTSSPRRRPSRTSRAAWVAFLFLLCLVPVSDDDDVDDVAANLKMTVPFELPSASLRTLSWSRVPKGRRSVLAISTASRCVGRPSRAAKDDGAAATSGVSIGAAAAAMSLPVECGVAPPLGLPMVSLTPWKTRPSSSRATSLERASRASTKATRRPLSAAESQAFMTGDECVARCVFSAKAATAAPRKSETSAEVASFGTGEQ